MRVIDVLETAAEWRTSIDRATDGDDGAFVLLARLGSESRHADLVQQCLVEAPLRVLDELRRILSATPSEPVCAVVVAGPVAGLSQDPAAHAAVAAGVAALRGCVQALTCEYATTDLRLNLIEIDGGAAVGDWGDVARTVRFLSSDAAGYVAGTSVRMQ